jgi:DNA polymerase-3 subunit alpha
VKWFLIFDTETTGLPKRNNAPIEDLDNWPRLVQLAWELHDIEGNLVEAKNYIVKPEGFTIPYGAEKVHGISTDKAIKEGYGLPFVLDEFEKDLENTRLVIGHNIEFDLNILAAEFLRLKRNNLLEKTPDLCTKIETTDFCQIPGGRGGSYKWPTLNELYHKLFSEGFDEAHNASADVAAEETAEAPAETVEETPVEEPVAEEAPVEEPKAEEKPAEEPKAEEAPAEEPKAEAAPVEEAPAAEEAPAEETESEDKKEPEA